ncbi:MAG: PilZ domain-containing protein [Halobacteriovoraceae bacterium]|mgnify:CR=1 FL=1|jgi:hypothetical protein|nr:PilZ domain-containing protein [Halobacteriovoraceae bacterium]MBT5094394.1 PilZ domain-containing protein [Halobacteriovoraceae bacterium]
MKELKRIEKASIIESVLEHLFRHRECLSFEWRDQKIHCSLVDPSSETLSIKSASYVTIAAGTVVEFKSNYKNLFFYSKVVSNKNGLLHIEFPHQLISRDLRDEERNFFGNQRKKLGAKFLKFTPVGRSGKNYNRPIVDFSGKGIAILIDILEPDLFEKGDEIDLKLPKEIQHMVGDNTYGRIKHIALFEKFKEKTFYRVWIEFNDFANPWAYYA